MNQNYRTLHKDIGLIQRSNKGWDLWFEDGDTVKAEDFHSLQVGIILACLTSWNYLNRSGNPTYQTFGNRAYELLKTNKSSMVSYKIQQYFIECLKRMRRVYEIVYLEVSEIPTEPYSYLVEFEVISISNQLVNGKFTVDTNAMKSSSYIEYSLYMPYASPLNPLIIDLWLKNEYGGGLDGELVYMYIDDEFIGVKGVTDNQGYIRITYDPKKFSYDSKIRFEYRGNGEYNISESDEKHFQQTPYCFNVDSSSDEKDILSIFDNIGDAKEKVWLGEIVSSLNDVNLEEDINYNKLYLIPRVNGAYTVYHYDGTSFVRDGQVRLPQLWDALNETYNIEIGDERLIVKDEDKWFLLSDNHIYYMENDISNIDINIPVDEEVDEEFEEIIPPEPIEMTTVTVRKVWDDYNNNYGLRPIELRVSLNNEDTYLLKESNNWEMSVEVPKYEAETGNEIEYNWTEQSIMGYTSSKSIVGNTTIFTNTYRRPVTPPTEPPVIEPIEEITP